MTKIFLRYSALFILLAATASALTPEQEVINAANKQCGAWIEKILVGKETLFGFKSRAEFKTVHVGIPFRMVKLNENFYSDQKLTSKNYISITDEWRVPVSVNGEDRILLTVVKLSGTYKVVDLGGVQLAAELQSLRKGHQQNLKNYLLRVYTTPMDFFVTSTSDESLANARVTPMALTKQLLPSYNKSVTTEFSIPETLSLIKEQTMNHQ